MGEYVKYKYEFSPQSSQQKTKQTPRGSIFHFYKYFIKPPLRWFFLALLQLLFMRFVCAIENLFWILNRADNFLKPIHRQRGRFKGGPDGTARAIE